MKRDLGLIRALLLEIEKHDDPTRGVDVTVEGYSPVQVSYHIKLLRDARFIVVQDYSSKEAMSYRAKSLTWQGHEFLDSLRNEGVWHRLLAHLKDRGMDVPVSVVQELATKIGAKLIGLED